MIGRSLLLSRNILRNQARFSSHHASGGVPGEVIIINLFLFVRPNHNTKLHNRLMYSFEIYYCQLDN